MKLFCHLLRCIGHLADLKNTDGCLWMAMKTLESAHKANKGGKDFKMLTYALKQCESSSDDLLVC